MKLVWVASTNYSHTLYKILPDDKLPKKMAWIACAYSTAQGYKKFWKARIIKTGEFNTLDTEQQAKDWAQAVVLLNQ